MLQELNQVNDVVVYGFKFIIALGILAFVGGVANFSSECDNLKQWFKLVLACFVGGVGFALISLGLTTFYLISIYIWG